MTPERKAELTTAFDLHEQSSPIDAVRLAMIELLESLAAEEEHGRESARDALYSLWLYGMNGRGPGGILYDIIKRHRADIAEYLDEHSADEAWPRFFGEEDGA